jgi:predicted nucleotidyltransferase
MTMTTKAEVIQQLRYDRAVLDRFGVGSIALFGSVARGEAGAGSDVDILVDYRPMPGRTCSSSSISRSTWRSSSADGSTW